jgi:crotonobetainyl-CoA:carnitine CoA-transferase CaiB-like acyl-CoA transferase
MTEEALNGIKVVEYSSFVSGPYCTKVLADLGAEVIKIEPPGAGDEARSMGPFLHDVPDTEISGLFLYLNTSKMGITLNIDSDAGKGIFKRLIAGADVLIEDRPPGEMKKRGLGYTTLKKVNPSLIMASITPFGQTGPYRNFKSYPLNTFHASGAGYLLPNFSPNLDREPIKGPGYIGEYDAGLCAAVAILGALHWRSIGGVGQYIDISKQEALWQLEKSFLGRYFDTGKSFDRTAIGSRTVLLPCKDGNQILIEYYQDHHWRYLCETMGNPEWVTDPMFNTDSEMRQNHIFELTDLLAVWTIDYTAEELFYMLQSHKCPAVPVNSAEQVYRSPHVESRGFFIDIEHPKTGKLKYPGAPFLFSETPWKVASPAPLMGQHNEEILCNRLGFKQPDLVKLKEAKVI